MSGIESRYKVERIDGKEDGLKIGIGSDTRYTESQYFVLRMGPKNPNKHTIAALKAYAESCHEEIPELARDIYQYCMRDLERVRK